MFVILSTHTYTQMQTHTWTHSKGKNLPFNEKMKGFFLKKRKTLIWGKTNGDSLQGEVEKNSILKSINKMKFPKLPPWESPQVNIYLLNYCSLWALNKVVWEWFINFISIGFENSNGQISIRFRSSLLSPILGKAICQVLWECSDKSHMELRGDDQRMVQQMTTIQSRKWYIF